MTTEHRLPVFGESTELQIDITPELVDRFAELVGDFNPIHMNEKAAQESGFLGRVAHGMSYACFLSTLIGTRLPGPGSLWASQTYRFLAAVYVGDCVTMRVEVIDASPSRRMVKLKVTVIRQTGELAMEGEGTIFLPHAEDEARGRVSATSRADGERVAIIAGAGGHLGSAIARGLVRDGFSVGVCGLGLTKVESLSAELASLGGVAIAARMNLTEEKSVDEAMHNIEKRLGPVDLVVHCATASLSESAPHETEWGVFREHLEVQLGGVHRLMRTVVPTMQERGGGQIIYIGSTATHGVPPKGMAAYTAGKAAATALIKSIAAELAPKGIRANIVSPHFIESDLTARVPNKMRKLIAAQTPMRRLAEVDEVASAVTFLASDRSTYINGHELMLDGGAVMR